MRCIVSLVSQEPLLFNMSIRENIVYGLNKQDVPMDIIIDVARKANIHDFISSLPQVILTNKHVKSQNKFIFRPCYPTISF